MSDLLIRLRQANPRIPLEAADCAAFDPYGMVLQMGDTEELVNYLQAHTPVPDGSAYTPSDPDMEALHSCRQLCDDYFGQLPTQAGWCNGTNRVLNALEYHAGVEVNVAASDLVLLLARQQEIADGQLDTAKVRGFLVKKGQAVLLYSTTLHFAPCAVESAGFRAAVLLPKGTNTPLDPPGKPGQLLRMKNKWLFAHPQANHLVQSGAYVGLTGDFIKLQLP